MEDKMIMIYPLIAIAIYALICCVDWGDKRSRASALRDFISEWRDGWTYPPFEATPSMVESLKKKTGLPVRLVVRYDDSGSACSRIYPKLDIDDVETLLRTQIEKGKTIVETRVRVFDADNTPPAPSGLVKAPSHIIVSIRLDKGQDPIDFDKTMDVIKMIFDNKEVK